MRVVIVSLALAAASAIAAARAEDDKAPKGDLGKLQGKWTAMVGANKEGTVVMTVEGNTVTYQITFQGEVRTMKGEIKIDESAKPYKTIDWLNFTLGNKTTIPDLLGIYEFVGQDLKVCNGGPGSERPTEFKEGANGPPRLVLLKKSAEK